MIRENTEGEYSGIEHEVSYLLYGAIFGLFSLITV